MMLSRSLGLIVIGWLLLTGLQPVSASGVSLETYTFTRVRSGPGTTYSIIGVLPPSEQWAVNARSSTSNDWLRINYNGTEGWVSAGVVTVQGDPTTLDVVTPSNAVSTVGNSAVSAWVSTGVNVRVGPGSTYPVIRQVSEGSASFDVTGRTAVTYPLVCQGSTIRNVTDGDAVDNVWLRINYNGFNAWVAYSVISVRGNVCAVPVVGVDTPSDEVRQTVEARLNTVIIVTANNVNLRRSNFPSSEVLTVIPYDTTLTVEARNADSSRLRVTYNDQTGWVATSQVNILLGSLSNLPIDEA